MLINLPLRKGEKIEKKEGKIWYFCSEEEIWNFAWKYIKIFSVLKITLSSWYDINDAQIKQKVDEKIWYARGKKGGKKKKTCTRNTLRTNHLNNATTTFSSSANQCQENWIHNLDNISDIREADTKYPLKAPRFYGF